MNKYLEKASEFSEANHIQKAKDRATKKDRKSKAFLGANFGGYAGLAVAASGKKPTPKTLAKKVGKGALIGTAAGLAVSQLGKKKREDKAARYAKKSLEYERKETDRLTKKASCQVLAKKAILEKQSTGENALLSKAKRLSAKGKIEKKTTITKPGEMAE